MEGTPLTVAELAARLAAIGGFEARPHLAVAVSGGPDSMALVLLADRWARRQGGSATALIIDHGLRPESAAEAETVAGWLRDRGIPRHILHWDGVKPHSGIQEVARQARYGLLVEWCLQHGVLHLLTAHHREDHVETYLIRRRAKSGVDGLAAMSAVRELAGCRLVRPLLAVPKARLKALLLAEGQLFVDDPSNRNPAFERARLRQPAAVASLCYPDPDPPPLPGNGRVGAIFSAIDNLLERTRACGTERVAREMVLGRLMAAAVSLHPAGFAVVDPSGFPSAAPELVERLFARVAGCVGVARYPVRRDRVARLRAGLMANPERPRTLGGCRFVPWRGRILVLRELAAASPPTRLEPGRALLWDRRFAVGPAAPGSALRFGYLGPDAAPAGQNIDRLPCGLPRLVYPVLPALRDEYGLVAVSHLGWRRDGYEGVLPGVSFRPLNPLARASFTVV